MLIAAACLAAALPLARIAANTVSSPARGKDELFGFLSTEANSIVAPIHPKAMPVILTTAEEIDLWLEGETVEALRLQRPLPDGMLDIVARGEKEDLARAIATASK
jgi:putative SOS response-associated peptidase YedK